ncbi:hypothetical protein PAECIP111893_02367 [Paenibacillus plantiphilus]|uniref:Uncharacterized protein n=2 Tax=Paenibacillus plantiphilus TaxID=2905650 RepID=A0ABM9C7Z3_9BACL|nr:hypothetical protein PAECIP111893_02367 [Paenibacillus plantiphilus]
MKNVPTREEIEAIRNSILLPFMLDMLEAELRKLQHDRQPLRNLFVEANESLSRDIFNELVTVRKYLKEHDIKVVEGDRVGEEMHYKFWCRGYEDEFMLMRFLAKSELSIRFGRYIGEMGTRWKKERLTR